MELKTEQTKGKYYEWYIILPDGNKAYKEKGLLPVIPNPGMLVEYLLNQIQLKEQEVKASNEFTKQIESEAQRVIESQKEEILRLQGKVKEAWDAGVDFDNECFCNSCDYCDLRGIENKAPDFEQWSKENKV